MGNNEFEEKRRPDPVVVVHGVKIEKLEKEQDGIKKALWGEDGNGGMSKKINDGRIYDSTQAESIAGLKKTMYLFNIPILLAVVGMALKYLFKEGA